MCATEMIYPNLCGVEMRYEAIDLPKGKVFNCFFISEHIADEEYIETQARKLLFAGVMNFCFYGECNEIWHEIFDITYVRLFLKELVDKHKEGIITIGSDDVDEFAEFIFDSLCTGTEESCMNLLFYDDENIYRQVRRQVEWLQRQNFWFHKVRHALKEMNPYGLLPDAPANEFYGQAEMIAEQISGSDSTEKVAKVMASVLTESFGDIFTSEECMEYAEMISNTRTTIMVKEPSPELTIEAANKLYLALSTEKELADLFAVVENKAWWIEDREYDYNEGIEEYKAASDMTGYWFLLADKIRDSIFEIIRSEGIVIPSSKQIDVLELFMKRNGYSNRDGWWISLS